MLEGDEWKGDPRPEPEPEPNELKPELSNVDVADHSLQLKMLYAQQRKSNWLSYKLIEQLETRFTHTFF